MCSSVATVASVLAAASSLTPAVAHSPAAARGICTSDTAFLFLSLKMLPSHLEWNINSYAAWRIASAASPCCTPRVIHYIPTTLAFSNVPNMFPSPGTCTSCSLCGECSSLTCAWLAAFCCSDMSLAITSSEMQRKHLPYCWHPITVTSPSSTSL